MQLRGEGFLPDTVVELGGQPVRDVLVVSSRALTFFTPALEPGVADLRVQNAFGTAELEAAFTVFQPLQPRRLIPSEGLLKVEVVRLEGEGLSAETVVLIGGQPLPRSGWKRVISSENSQPAQRLAPWMCASPMRLRRCSGEPGFSTLCVPTSSGSSLSELDRVKRPRSRSQGMVCARRRRCGSGRKPVEPSRFHPGADLLADDAAG